MKRSENIFFLKNYVFQICICPSIKSPEYICKCGCTKFMPYECVFTVFKSYYVVNLTDCSFHSWYCICGKSSLILTTCFNLQSPVSFVFVSQVWALSGLDPRVEESCHRAERRGQSRGRWRWPAPESRGPVRSPGISYD